MMPDPHMRRFGVEIEFASDGSGHSGISRLIGCQDGGWKNPDGWVLGNDGSELELKTPILQGPTGFSALQEMMERLSARGCYVTGEDGLHVHHDAPEFMANPRLAEALGYTWIRNRAAIHGLVHPDRSDSWACPNLTESDLDWVMAELGEEENDRYSSPERCDLNLYALTYKGTIEVRLHEGTLDPDVAIAWIMFGQRLIHEVVQRAQPLLRESSDEALMQAIKLNPDARKRLLAKKGHFGDLEYPASDW